MFLGVLGTLSNEDGNVSDDGSEKSPFWFTLNFFVCFIKIFTSFLFFGEKKKDLMFLYEAKQILRMFSL